MTDHLFDTDTSVERAGEQPYRATLTDNWNALGSVPNGGDHEEDFEIGDSTGALVAQSRQFALPT